MGVLLSSHRSVMAAFRIAGRALRRLCSWIGEKGYIHDYDLSLADEIFAVFAGVTLLVSYTDWLASHPEIILTIVVSVALTVIAILVAINQRRFWVRVGCYLIAVLLAYAGVESIRYVSAHDLSARPLNALPIGVLVWLSIREIAVFIMNAGRRSSSTQE